MKKLGNFYIDGQWVEPISPRLMSVLNPASGQQIGTLALGNAQDVDRAVSAADTAFASFSQTTKAERLDLLKRLEVVTKRRLEDLAQAISLEMGAPISMARNAQAEAGLGHLQGFIEVFEAYAFEETLSNGDRLVREPIGVCGLITPWNWPINQIALKVVPALATGCTCVLKPSEHTPISAMIYAEIVEEAGYPAGVFNLVHGDGPTAGAALSKHPDVQMMSFTGSTRAGKAVTRDAAETIKRVTLELGGKSPNLLFADCGQDLGTRVIASVGECMYNTGQSCDAPTRLLVEDACYDQVLELATKACQAIEVGDPALEGEHIGPLFDQIQYDRVQALIQAGLDEGAHLLCGGLGKPGGFEAGWYAKPTLFAHVTQGMRIAREEIFGPVLIICRFEDEAEAIALANDTPYGLAAYIQIGDMARAERVAKQLKAGAIHVNGAALNYGTPFGGFKQSGNGREGGLMGLEDYLETKSLHGLS